MIAPDGGTSGKVSMAAPAVGAAAGAAAGAGGASGGYEFDPEKIDDVIRQWQDLETDLRTDESDAHAMASVKAPGKEFASGDFAKSANPSGKAFLEQNKRMRDYVAKYIEALQDAKKKIQTKEADVQADINQTGNRAQ